MQNRRILIVVNKDEPALSASETFIHAHIKRLPGEVRALIGGPGYRKIYGENEFLCSRNFIPLTLRLLRRKLGIETASEQDTKALVKFIKDNKFDALLAEYGSSAVSVMRACKETNIPLIAHFHGWDAYSNYMISTYFEEYKKLFEMAAAIVTVSTHMRGHLIKMGAPRGKTHCNSCGADIPSHAMATPGKVGRRFVMVGRLTAKKSPLTSIEAFAKVHSNFPDATLDIIGDGPLRQEVIRRVRQRGLQNAVILHGAKPHEYVISTLRQARCFIQHSVRAEDGDHEGTPVAVLEAMLMGLPVVATRHGGILDIIEEGVCGTLVDEHDVDGMAKKMALFASSTELSVEFGARARQKVLSQYTVEKSVRNLWNIIEACVKK